MYLRHLSLTRYFYWLKREGVEKLSNKSKAQEIEKVRKIEVSRKEEQ